MALRFARRMLVGSGRGRRFEIQSLSLCIVAQGRKAVTVGGETYRGFTV